MEIKKFQEDVLKVFSEMDKMPNRQKHTKQSALIHLVEEIGEVARQVTNEFHRPEKFDIDNFGKEIGDTLMFIVVLAHLYDIDLSKEMQDGIRRVKTKIDEISK
jgi:NTP pyrophosphatase (non-canonical NTP hydrolase)